MVLSEGLIRNCKDWHAKTGGFGQSACSCGCCQYLGLVVYIIISTRTSSSDNHAFVSAIFGLCSTHLLAKVFFGELESVYSNHVRNVSVMSLLTLFDGGSEEIDSRFAVLNADAGVLEGANCIEEVVAQNGFDELVDLGSC